MCIPYTIDRIPTKVVMPYNNFLAILDKCECTFVNDLNYNDMKELYKGSKSELKDVMVISSGCQSRPRLSNLEMKKRLRNLEKNMKNY